MRGFVVGRLGDASYTIGREVEKCGIIHVNLSSRGLEKLGNCGDAMFVGCRVHGLRYSYSPPGCRGRRFPFGSSSSAI